MDCNDPLKAGEDSQLSEADEMQLDSHTILAQGYQEADLEEQLAALRGEKSFLEFRNSELEDQVNELKRKLSAPSVLDGKEGESPIVANLRADYERMRKEYNTTVEKLEHEVKELRQGIDEAQTALDLQLSEKQQLEDKLRGNEAVFNERKRNFDHIITIFGEEKRQLAEEKAKVEERLDEAEEELRAYRQMRRGGSQSPGAECDDVKNLRERIDELESMLGQSGLARQELEERIAQCEGDKADLEKQVDVLRGELKAVKEEANSGVASETLQAKIDECNAKAREVADLKAYVGKKAVQWDQFKEEAALARQQMEAKYEERCRELDNLQNTIQEAKVYTDELKQELAVKTTELEEALKEKKEAEEQKEAKKETGDFTVTELMSLLEEKEQQIEELNDRLQQQGSQGEVQKLLRDLETARKEATEAKNQQRILSDEVTSLKSTVFKLEHRSNLESYKESGRRVGVSPGRTSSPAAFSRAMTATAPGASRTTGIRHPSPTNRVSCLSPSVHSTHRTATPPLRTGTRRTSSPTAPRHPSPSHGRTTSPGLSSRRPSLQQWASKPSRVGAVAEMERRRVACNSPSRRPGTLPPGLMSPSSSLRSTMNTRTRPKSVTPAAPLSSRSVNRGDV